MKDMNIHRPVRAKALIHIPYAFALTGRNLRKTSLIDPGCRCRSALGYALVGLSARPCLRLLLSTQGAAVALPWAMRSLGFQPALA